MEKKSMENEKVKDYVKKRYAEIANGNQNCCSSSCCSSSKDISENIGYSRKELDDIPNEAVLGLGCGNPVALAGLKQGNIVLDLGSGAGIDVFLASKRVGVSGKVIGVDMTEAMINKATTLAKDRGLTNVEFRLGEIEALPIEDNSVDVVISNCVINLCPNKKKAFIEIFRVLKGGGRLVISDLVTNGKLPKEVKQSFEAWAECIAGALEKDIYLKIIEEVGFSKIKIIKEIPYTFDVSKQLQGKILSISVEAHKMVA